MHKDNITGNMKFLVNRNKTSRERKRLSRNFHFRYIVVRGCRHIMITSLFPMNTRGKDKRDNNRNSRSVSVAFLENFDEQGK